MFRELRNRKTMDYKLLNDKGMEDAMKSEGEFLIEKELTPIKSRKLVAVDSDEMDEEALEKLKREQKKKERGKIKKEITPMESESDDSKVELEKELVSLKKELEKVNRKRREHKMKEKDKIRKEIENVKKKLKKTAEKEKGDDKVNQSVIISKTNLISQKTVVWLILKT